jgi:GntR family transcriptional regulator
MREEVELNKDFVIDKESPVPYYHQLKMYLLSEIESGNWLAQQKLPSETEFCERFDISRTVVRQAIKELQIQGHLATKKGLGTFISRPKIITGFVQNLVGFYEEFTKRGYKVTTKIEQLKVEHVSPRIADMLRIAAGEPVIRLSRLRKLNNEPSAYVTTYIPQAICPQLLETDLENKSLYTFLEKYGLELHKGHRYIGVTLANEYEASLLNIEVGAPLIELDHVTYLKDGRPLEYFHALHRGDRSKFEVELVRFNDIYPQDKI